MPENDKFGNGKNFIFNKIWGVDISTNYLNMFKVSDIKLRRPQFDRLVKDASPQIGLHLNQRTVLVKP